MTSEPVLDEEWVDQRDPDTAYAADEHEQWLRDNLPPHHL